MNNKLDSKLREGRFREGQLLNAYALQRLRELLRASWMLALEDREEKLSKSIHGQPTKGCLEHFLASCLNSGLFMGSANSKWKYQAYSTWDLITFTCFNEHSRPWKALSILDVATNSPQGRSDRESSRRALPGKRSVQVSTGSRGFSPSDQLLDTTPSIPPGFQCARSSQGQCLSCRSPSRTEG